MNEFINKSRTVIWVLFFPQLLLLSFYVSWSFWSSQNFLYEFWYDHTELPKFIDYYAPKNNFKFHFENTTREERIRLFSRILEEVDSDAKNLDKIHYYSKSGEDLGLMLHQNEIVHLKDVNKLIIGFKKVSWIALGLAFMSFIFFYKTKSKNVFSFSKVIKFYFIFIVVLLSGLWFVGPLQVFELLHKLVFPDGHQWFFYYQDSLMTTLMMAPTLFFYFAGIWCGTSLLIFFVVVFCLGRLLNRN